MNYRNIFRKKTLESALLSGDSSENKLALKKSLRVRDLTALGIAAIVGAGIFSAIGNTAGNGGPAVSLLFVFTGLACGFSALCYAQFASSIPISGSAYTYAYTTFGEIVAWIIGWSLILEYGFGNIAVAISWSDYFTGLMQGLGVHIPDYLSTDYLSATRAHQTVTEMIASGKSLNEIPMYLQTANNAWLNAPIIGNLKIIADIPAFCIVSLITLLVYMGINQTKMASNIMVIVKISVLLIVIIVGLFYVNPANWTPFAPNGAGGVLKGVAGVFFAYIGFDAISTTAEECKNPQRDLPRGMIYSLLICTILYVILCLVITGMVPSSELLVGNPLAYVFHKLNLTWLSGVVAFSAIVAMASVLLVFQVGQPRIWFSMSRDGMLPKSFSKIHPKYKTPYFATLFTGIFVAIPVLFMNLTEVTDLSSIGTLFVFSIVCGGVLLMDKNKLVNQKGFKIPYFNCRYYLIPIYIITISGLIFFNYSAIVNFISTLIKNPLSSLQSIDFLNHLPRYIFILGAFVFLFLAFKKSWSLIPVLGLLTNLYLMAELSNSNWIRFLIWLGIGLSIYFLYSYRKAKSMNP